MPCNDSLGFDDHECGAPIGPEARDPNPEESIGRIQCGLGRKRTSQDLDLMSQREDLSLECKACSAGAKEGMSQRKHYGTHEPEASSLIPQVQYFQAGQSFWQAQRHKSKAQTSVWRSRLGLPDAHPAAGMV